MKQISAEQNVKLLSSALEVLNASNVTDVDFDYVRFLADEIDRQITGGTVESHECECEDGDADDLMDSIDSNPFGIVEKSIATMQDSAGELASELIALKKLRGMTSEDVAESLGVDVESIESLETEKETSMGDWILYAVTVGGHIDINVTTLEALSARYPYLENNYEVYRQDDEG